MSVISSEEERDLNRAVMEVLEVAIMLSDTYERASALSEAFNFKMSKMIELLAQTRKCGSTPSSQPSPCWVVPPEVLEERRRRKRGGVS